MTRTRMYRKIKMAVDYIEENYAKDLNMAVVSNYISMNYSLFFLLIQAVYRKQFCELSQGNPREERQKLLTETDMKIIEISQASQV